MVQFLVRYLDFGNSETRGSEYLVALKSEFREIPFQAFQCSIACSDHASFTNKVRWLSIERMKVKICFFQEIECFEKVVTDLQLEL